MQTSNQKSGTHFLGKLVVPIHLCMMRGVIEYTGQVGHLLALNDKEVYALKVAVEEAFSNAVTHFSGPVQIDDHITVEFLVIDVSLIISIREKGIPFDRRRGDTYTPGTMDKMDKPGLGMMLMHHGMDKVEHLVHGRKGKETRLTKHLKPGTLPKGLLALNTVKESPRYTLAKEAVIRLTNPDELNEVIRLAWKCYGYTQEEILYDIDTFTQKIEDGELISIVALDPDRNAIMGHIGLKHHDPLVKVPELGLAFVDPAYRNSGLALSLGKKALDIAKETNCSGMFDCSVTTHPFSQQGMHTLGSRPCGLFMGIAAAGLQARQLATSTQEKGSVVNHYYAFDRSPRTVFVPAHHQDMVNDIYGWLELPRLFEPGDPTPAKGPSSISVFPMPAEHNAAFIIVHTIGKDTASEVATALADCKRKRMDAVYSFLPLESSHLPLLVDQLEKTGLSFAGIMPHIHNGEDRLLMQYINIPINHEAIKLYGDMTPKLFTYILGEQDRIGT